MATTRRMSTMVGTVCPPYHYSRPSLDVYDHEPFNNLKIPAANHYDEETMLKNSAHTSAYKPAYKRVLLKLSGEALMGDDAYGINRHTIERMVADVAEIKELGVELAI